MTTETTQEAPPALWCDNPAHAEEGVAVPAVYRTTWPDGRFKPANACEDCLDEHLRFYVFDDDMDGRLHPVLIELAGASPVTDELTTLRAKLTQAEALIGQLERITTAWTRGMYSARIDCWRDDPNTAAACLSEGLDGYDGPEWDGTETGAEWWERTKAEEGL